MKPIFVYLVVMRLNDAKTAVIFLDVKRRVQLDFINYPSVKTILDRANVQACVLRISQEYLGESENRMLPIHPCHTADIQYSNRSVYNFIPSHLAQGRLQLYITFLFSFVFFKILFQLVKYIFFRSSMFHSFLQKFVEYSKAFF